MVLAHWAHWGGGGFHRHILHWHEIKPRKTRVIWHWTDLAAMNWLPDVLVKGMIKELKSDNSWTMPQNKDQTSHLLSAPALFWWSVCPHRFPKFRSLARRTRCMRSTSVSDVDMTSYTKATQTHAFYGIPQEHTSRRADLCQQQFSMAVCYHSSCSKTSNADSSVSVTPWSLPKLTHSAHRDWLS